MLQLSSIFSSANLCLKRVGVYGLLSFAFAPGFASAAIDKEAYQQCITESVAPAEDWFSAQPIKRACTALYDNSSMLSDDDIGYYQCIIQYMPTANNKVAVKEIEDECNDQHRSLFN
ncbi:hypothetical protein JCM19241_1090 [Vibrio ishigakensis]|uniref:Uncharacterized protein n=1 Tax=Vibrio ishigakensis TaxID=1481914 RepID=A0A0B8QCR7_9VIBR|nr:hypothetical protein JCM19241_1090 [Vibrio ishigakensis]